MTPAMSLITVVIPTYNREKYLPTAIESVLNQTHKEWKLLIVDDASTDHTQAIVKKYLVDPRIHYMLLPENSGIGKTMAAALERIDTPYFVSLDSDDWFDEKTLEILLDEMERQPETTNVVFSNTVFWKEVDGKRELSEIMRPPLYEDKYYYLEAPMVWPRFYRTQAVRDVGGFECDDPMQGRYSHDKYMLLKLIGTGDIHWVDANLYHYLIHESNNSHTKNWPQWTKARKYILTKILKLWGDEYEPVFVYTPEGWIYVNELIPKEKPS
ncbi:glycosyltransferase family 2 protein [Brevibacillus formosus]|uniref:Glycosyl transferase family A n=2 Tax=Brevibacillus formosus TaxID=54913 RepID=A0ABQ0TCH1_9BACL|nr:glycosyltransferase family 2 protein [Brevibacillus formosus]MED1957999.1 glycosyltransferase family 2 protein [Brevibacillus formosus]GED61002.1 glycosyl transferase family A [Brevibacillus formosus]